jgi:hypothetical protein
MYRTVGRRPTHNELVFKFGNTSPPFIMKKFHPILCAFLCFPIAPFPVGRSIMFMLNVAVILESNA